MTPPKSKAIEDLELRLKGMEPASFRYKTLEAALRFKNSWIQLGQVLRTVYQDKLFKDWGYLTFEAYCAKEIGIRQATAVKLLRSYSFLEREEPAFLKKQSDSDSPAPARVPGYEAVNALRLAQQNERIPKGLYEELREEVLEGAKEDAEVKKKIRYVLNSHPKELTPEEKAQKKEMFLQRLILGLKNAKTGLGEHGYPAKVTRQVDELIDSLEELQS